MVASVPITQPSLQCPIYSKRTCCVQMTPAPPRKNGPRPASDAFNEDENDGDFDDNVVFIGSDDDDDDDDNYAEQHAIAQQQRKLSEMKKNRYKNQMEKAERQERKQRQREAVLASRAARRPQPIKTEEGG